MPFYFKISYSKHNYTLLYYIIFSENLLCIDMVPELESYINIYKEIFYAYNKHKTKTGHKK